MEWGVLIIFVGVDFIFPVAEYFLNGPQIDRASGQTSFRNFLSGRAFPFNSDAVALAIEIDHRRCELKCFPGLVELPCSSGWLKSRLSQLYGRIGLKFADHGFETLQH